MTVGFGVASTGIQTGASATLAVTHNLEAGANVVFCALVRGGEAAAPTSWNWNSSAYTLISSAQGGTTGCLWVGYHLNPQTGNLVSSATWAVTARAAMIVWGASGVDSTSPVTSTAISTGDSSAFSTTISSMSAGQMAVSVWGGMFSTAATLTSGAGMTKIGEAGVGAAAPQAHFVAGYKAQSSATMTVSWTAPGANPWYHAGFAVSPAGAPAVVESGGVSWWY